MKHGLSSEHRKYRGISAVDLSNKNIEDPDFSRLDDLFDSENYKKEGVLITPMSDEAYRNRYTVLAEDVKAPIESPEVYQDTSLDYFDELIPPQQPSTLSEAPEVETEATLYEQVWGVGKEAVRGSIEGIQGIYDTLEDFDEGLQDLGVPNYAVYWDENEGLKFGKVDKETSNSFSIFNQEVTQFAPDISENEQTIVSDFVNEATEFLTAYAFAGAAIRPLKAGATATAAARGAAADFADYEVESLMQMADDIPALSPYISEWMLADGEDPELVQRMYVAIEGLGLGILADKIIDGTRAGIKKLKSNNKNNKQQIGNVEQQQIKQEAEEPKPEGTEQTPSEAPTKTEEGTAEAPNSADSGELTKQELDISDEVQALYRADPNNPNLARLYDEMAANGKIQDRPSTVREITDDQVERILRGIESDPDNLTVEYYNINRMGNTPKEVLDAINYTSQAFDTGESGLNKFTPEYKPFDQTIQEVAEDLSANPKDIIKNLEEVAGVTGSLDVWVGQARALQVQAGNEAYDLAAKVIDEAATVEEQIEFIRRLQVLEQVNEIMTGIKTGTGRGLSSMQIHTTEYLTPELQKVLKRRVCNL
jgi:hypothetical protein